MIYMMSCPSNMTTTLCDNIVFFSYFSVLTQDEIIDSDAIAIDFGKQVSTKIFGGILAICVVSL